MNVYSERKKTQPEVVLNVLPACEKRNIGDPVEKLGCRRALSPLKPRHVGLSGRPQLGFCFLPAQPDGGGRGETLNILTLMSWRHIKGMMQAVVDTP